MNSDQLLARFRKGALWLSITLCLGVVTELLLTGHTQQLLQWLPITLCLIAIAPMLAVLLRPGRWSIQALRGMMLAMALAGLLGAYEHVTGNLALMREVNPAKAAAAPIKIALTGANPALAPGALGVTALIALAATWWHPALGGKR